VPVAPVVLPVLGKAFRGVGIEVHLRLVVLHDRVEAHEERILGVAEVADDLLRSPVLRVRTARQGGVSLVMYRRGQLVRRPRHAFEPRLERLLRVLLDGRHLAPPLDSAYAHARRRGQSTWAWAVGGIVTLRGCAAHMTYCSENRSVSAWNHGHSV